MAGANQRCAAAGNGLVIRRTLKGSSLAGRLAEIRGRLSADFVRSSSCPAMTGPGAERTRIGRRETRQWRQLSGLSRRLSKFVSFDNAASRSIMAFLRIREVRALPAKMSAGAPAAAQHPSGILTISQEKERGTLRGFGFSRNRQSKCDKSGSALSA